MLCTPIILGFEGRHQVRAALYAKRFGDIVLLAEAIRLDELRLAEWALGQVDAMRAGIYYGYLGLIEGIVQKIENEMKARPFVLATGGLAPLFAGGTDVIDKVDQDLTLRGLQVIYTRMQS